MDFHELPRLSDSISFLYIEHAIIEQDNSSVVMIQSDGKTPIPITSVTCLLIGPSTSITHAAVRTLSANGCQIVWCGESASPFYAYGMGETRSAENLLLQAKLCMNEDSHMRIATKMYEMRFPKLSNYDYSLQQLRGMEGIRVREAYKAADRYGIDWKGRHYKQTNWEESDQINHVQ